MADSQELDIELALDRIEGQLDDEMRQHVTAFAAAYAAGTSLPGAPDLSGRASTAAVAKRALTFPTLRPRAVRLLRLVAPILIERDAAVAAARSREPTWAGLRALAAARDAVAVARFRRPALDVLHQLSGIREASVLTLELPAAIGGWTETDHVLEDRALDDAWRYLAELAGAAPALEIIRTDMVRPRFFAVDRGSTGIAVVPKVIDTPAKRFGVLHELGHALVNQQSSYEWPRAFDEAGASYVARLMEAPDQIPGRWYSPLASVARARRTQIARVLDTVERTIQNPTDPPFAKPPWALWHDPGAQAAYVRAEAIAEDIWTRLGPPREGLSIGQDLVYLAIELDSNLAI
ncbi:MAG: hypothetical protein H0T42_03355 [Deltaproteobacteria bacterium]|nr:hypothetical protein [Deltaproteobacteria bacterium]